MRFWLAFKYSPQGRTQIEGFDSAEDRDRAIARWKQHLRGFVLIRTWEE